MSESFLSGVRVIESAVLLNGDTVGMLLGDLGADVIKVESPGRGDYIRDFLGQITPHNSPAHLQVNRNKRSITLDLRQPSGVEAFWKLIDSADIFVDGGMPGALDKLGLGWEAQRARNPRLIYCQYSGFGASGPYAAIPAHGMMMNALVGATPMEHGADGVLHPKEFRGLGGTERGGDATTTGALQAVMHTLAALLRRDRLGVGCYIDVAASDAVILAAVNTVSIALNEHRLTDRSSLPTIDGREWTGARYQYYETKDHQILLFAAIEPKFYARFAELVGLNETPAPESGPVSFGADDALRTQLAAIFVERDLADWISLAAQHGIPISPVPENIVVAAEDPHLRARDIIVEGDHPDAGPFTYVGRAAVVPEVPFATPSPAPSLGQHTDEVLAAIGYDADAIAVLRAERVI